ncbi:phage tail tape measure protein [Streptomyces sp. NPDC056161]|uniref:phage tail tape measure protein n=1 Tax=Streptomyces sp. NPDC056161 TaxID=3345732 RepID=UPI0035D96DC2
MAGDEVDYGSARITLDLDVEDAERQARDVGTGIERALTRAMRDVGRTVRNSINGGLRGAAANVQVAPDLSRFERALRTGVRGITDLTVPVVADLRSLQRSLSRRGVLDSVALPVTPDVSGFGRALQRAIRQVRAQVPVAADSRALVRDIQAQLRRVRAPRISVQADVDVSRVQSRLRSLEVPRIDATVVLDVGRIEARLRELAQREITIPIHLGEPGGGGGGGEVAEGLLSRLRSSLAGAGEIGLGFGAEAMAGIRAGLTAAGPWGAVIAAVLAYAALIGKALMTGIEGVIEKQKLTGALRAALGLGTKDADAAGRVVGQLYARGVVDSVEEGTAAVQAAIRAGLAAPSDFPGLESLSTKIADLGTLMEEDVGAVARAVGQMVKTGLVDNASQGIDLLTKSVQQGGNAAEDLLDTVTEYGTQFRQLGLSGQEAFGLIQQGLRGGARDSDVIADTLKEFSIEAAQGGTRVVDAFKAMHLNATQLTEAFAKGGPSARKALGEILDKLHAIKDPLKRNQAAVGLFGTKAEDLAGAIEALDLKTAAKEMDDFGGAATRAGDDLRNNLGSKFETIGRELKQAFQGLFTGDFSQFADIGKAIQDALPLLKSTGEQIAVSISQGIVQYGPKVFEAVFDLASQIGEKVDIWGPLLLKVAAGAAAIPALIGGLILTALIGALQGLGGKILPYLEIAWDAVVNFFTETVPVWGSQLGGAISDALSSAWESAKSAVSSGISAVVGFFAQLPVRIVEAAGAVGSAVGDLFVSGFDLAVQTASAGVQAVVDFFVQLPGRIVAGLAVLPGLLLDAFTSAIAYLAIGVLAGIAGIVYIFTELPQKIGASLVSLGTLLLTAFQVAWATVTTWLSTAITTTVAFFQVLPGRVANALSSFGTFLVSRLVTGFSAANSRITSWISSAVAFFQALPGRVGSALSSFGTFLVSRLVTGFNAANSRITSWISSAVGFFRALPGKIGSALSSLGSRIGGAFSSAAGSARSAVSSLISGLVSLFGSLPGRIVAAIGNVGGQIMSKIKSGIPASVRKYLPFANGGLVLGPTHALIGEAGPEVVIPLTRPKRAAELAEQSGLLDMLRGTAQTRGTQPAVVNQYVTINEVGDARTTAHRVASRLALAGGLL